jgi:hypothetical protein
MKSEYINALEMRLRWLEWAKKEGDDVWRKIQETQNMTMVEKVTQGILDYSSYAEALPAYVHALQTGDTFFMNKNFGSLVENARSTIPDDLAFEMSWAHSPQGWMWLEEPFVVPNPESAVTLHEDVLVMDALQIRISALGWYKVSEDKMYFLCYQDFQQYGGKTGFGCWSHFTLKQGDKVLERIRQFEKTAKDGAYKFSRETDMKHEIRWIYAALYLMAQRLAHHTDLPLDRHTRRRHEKTGKKIPPNVRIVSLRRLEEDRKKLGPGTPQDWQWQWHVKGHWRLQPYKTLGDYKWIFIEAYIKGPEDKPLKPLVHTLFKAVR